MNDRDTKILGDLLQRYRWQYDRNSYMRNNYNEDLEYYRGYRNASDYPIAFSEVFNRILPIIHTLLSRFMDQLYQAGNIISVKPRKKKDVQRAKSVEGVLNYQMEVLNDIDGHGGSYLTMMKWFFNTITFGKGIVKLYWRKEERLSPRRIAMPVPNFDRMGNFQGFDILDKVNQEMQVVYDGPYAEVIHNKCFIPHPEYKSIQQMPQVFLLYKRSIDEVKRMVDKGIYRNFDEMGMRGTGYNNYEGDTSESVSKSKEIEGYDGVETEESEYKTPDVDILEAYAKIILKDEPYEVGSGYKIKGKEEECIVHIGNYKTILSLQVNPYGMRPLFDMGCYYHPELYWDLGMVQLTKGIQEQINNLANLRMANAYMLINPMLKVNTNSDIDPEYLTWKPFGVIPVDDMRDVEPMIVPDTNSNLFMEQESFYKNTIQDIMGMYDYCEIVEGKDTDYEILTHEGWKKFDELTRDELVMTLNYETDEMSWQKPTDYIDSPILDFDCYHFKNQSAEFICSPKHRLPLISNGKKKIERIQDIPEESYSSHAIPIAGFNWVGNTSWTPPFPNITKEDWCAFMGIWIAEGHTSKANGAYQIGIGQDKKANPDKCEEIFELLKRLPFDFREDSRGTTFYTYNKELYSYLSEFGKSHDKFIPFEIKNAPPYLLRIFLDWYLMGDGSFVRGEHRFTTVSEKLADDLQEIVLKLGNRTAIRFDSGHERWSGEISINHRNVYLQGSKGQQAITKKKIKGRMTCLTVPNGIFLIRRDKKPMWTGNSMGQTPTRQERVGVVYGIQAMGEARAKLLLMSMDYLGIRPLLKYMMLLNTFHLPSGFEYRIGDKEDQQQFGNVFGSDIHSDFDFAARYTAMEPALGKQFRAQQLIQMAQMWMQSPWINQYQMQKTLMELLDIREADYLLKTPQQFQQEMQAQTQQQMQMAIMGKRMESQAEAQKAMLDGKVKSKLSDQEFRQDVILQAMENEAIEKKEAHA